MLLPTMRWVCLVLAVGFSSLALLHEPANAQTTCPNVASTPDASGPTSVRSLFAESTPVCSTSVGTVTSYSLTTFQLPNHTFVAYIGDNSPITIPGGARFRIRNGSSGTSALFTTIICGAASSTSPINQGTAEVTLPAGGSCALTLIADQSGILLSFQGQLSRVGDVYGLTGGTLSGGIFGGTAASTTPTITSVTPNTGTTAGGAVVTITGTNFTGVTTVTFGGNAATAFTVDSATQISATTPAGIAGAVDVAVTAPTGTAISTGGFTYAISGSGSSGSPGAAGTSSPSVAITAPAETRGPFTATITFSENVNGFDLGDVSVGNGNASGFAVISASVYTAIITPTGTTITSDVTLDVAAGVATDIEGDGNSAAERSTVRFINEAVIVNRTKSVVSNFLSGRADQITANAPDIVTRLNGGGSGGGSGPANFTAHGTLGNNLVNFSTSLRQIFQARAARKTEIQSTLLGGGDAAAPVKGITVGRARTAIDRSFDFTPARGELSDRFGFASNARQFDGHRRGLSGSERQDGLMALGAVGQQFFGVDPIPNGFDIWVSGKVLQVESDTAESDIGLLYVGADYRFNSLLLIGVLAQFDFTDETDEIQDTVTKGDGWMAGPYVAARLYDNLIFDGWIAFGQSKNEVNIGIGIDEFDTKRWLAKAQLTGGFERAGFNIEPSVGISFFEEDQEGFTNSLGIFISGQTVTLGRVTFGPKISTQVAGANGSVFSPHVSFKGLWDFDRSAPVSLATGLAVGTNELRGRIDGGFTILGVSGVTLAADGFYDGIGASNFEAFGGAATVSVPLN